jgi:tetratricopeptide (TPR) repeat protein
MKVPTIQRRFAVLFGGAGLIAFGLSFANGIKAAEERFDAKVRQDFFAGFAGDKAALARGMSVTEAALKENPKNAEAMVWHGTGLFSQAGAAFRAGDQDNGMELFTKAMTEMDDAVALEPNRIAVRIPRGAVLLKASVYMPEEVAAPLIEKGISDYEKAYDIQKDRLAEMGEHPRGELLFGLADAYSRLGNTAKAKVYFERVATDMKGTVYGTRAAKWLETKSLTKAESGCVGCHIK